MTDEQEKAADQVIANLARAVTDLEMALHDKTQAAYILENRNQVFSVRADLNSLSLFLDIVARNVA